MAISSTVMDVHLSAKRIVGMALYNRAGCNRHGTKNVTMVSAEMATDARHAVSLSFAVTVL
jgi:hypothetical protein